MEAKERLEMMIKSELQTELNDIFERAKAESWAPKLPATSSANSYHSHLEDFALFYRAKVVHMTAFNPELACPAA